MTDKELTIEALDATRDRQESLEELGIVVLNYGKVELTGDGKVLFSDWNIRGLPLDIWKRPDLFAGIALRAFAEEVGRRLEINPTEMIRFKGYMNLPKEKLT